MYELFTLSASHSIANLSGGIRRETRNGRSYLVAPITLLMPGVVPGDKGPLLYRPDLLARNPEDWNDVAMVVYHPKRDGKFVSARHPDVLEKSEIGRIYNMGAGGPPRGEGWFDEERTQKIDSRVYNALIQGKKIEVSTGIVQMSRPAPPNSTYEGKPYIAEVIAYKPDHLAILPDEIGACPVTAGCGVNNAQPSHDDLRHQLQMLLDARYGVANAGPNAQAMMGCYILDVYDKEVIYSAYEKLWKIKYVTHLRTATVSLANEAPVEVRRVITYKPVSNSQGETSEVEPVISYEEILDVNREQLITFLVTNCDCWKGNGDRDTLNKFTDQKLNELKNAYDKAVNAEAVANAARQGFKDGDRNWTFDEKTKQWVQVSAPTPTVNTAVVAVQTPPQIIPVAKPLTHQEWMASAPPEIQAVVNNAIRRDNEEKANLIAQLTANVTTEPEKANLTAWLQQQNVDNLRNMARLYPAKATPQQSQQINGSIVTPQPSYQLASAPAPVNNGGNQTNNAADEDILPLPVMDLTSKSA